MDFLSFLIYSIAYGIGCTVAIAFNNLFSPRRIPEKKTGLVLAAIPAAWFSFALARTVLSIMGESPDLEICLTLAEIIVNQIWLPWVMTMICVISVCFLMDKRRSIAQPK